MLTLALLLSQKIVFSALLVCVHAPPVKLLLSLMQGSGHATSMQLRRTCGLDHSGSRSCALIRQGADAHGDLWD